MLDPASTVLLDVNKVSQTYAKGSGEPGAPVLHVNPISAVAPGFTKEILDALKPAPLR